MSKREEEQFLFSLLFLPSFSSQARLDIKGRIPYYFLISKILCHIMLYPIKKIIRREQVDCVNSNFELKGKEGEDRWSSPSFNAELFLCLSAYLLAQPQAVFAGAGAGAATAGLTLSARCLA